MKLTWARELRTQRRWGNDILARIYFRSKRNGREPTKQELALLLHDQAALTNAASL